MCGIPWPYKRANTRRVRGGYDRVRRLITSSSVKGATSRGDIQLQE